MKSNFDTNRWRTPFDVIRNSITMLGYRDCHAFDCATDEDQMDAQRYEFFSAGYFSPEEDALSKSLPYGVVGWLNPPYRKRGQPIIEWCQWAATQKSPVVMLLPASTSTKWFHDVVMRSAETVIFVRNRICFERENNGVWVQEKSPRHDSIIVGFPGTGLSTSPNIKTASTKQLMRRS